MADKKQGLIYIMDMESSLSDAIARRMVDVDQFFVYRPWNAPIDCAAEMETYKEVLRGIIITGSGRNINNKDPLKKPVIPPAMFQAGVPILGICYGMQHLANLQGVKIVRCWKEQDPTKRVKDNAKKDAGEQGVALFQQSPSATQSPLFIGLGDKFNVWMKHNWMLENLPAGWTLLGSTALCPVAAMECGNLYALQFHPEPFHSLAGRTIINNFIRYICKLDTPYF